MTEPSETDRARMELEAAEADYCRAKTAYQKACLLVLLVGTIGIGWKLVNLFKSKGEE